MKVYHTIDKSAWGDGPWQHEPDKIQLDLVHGFPALIKRNPSGALCGYVGVERTHPAYGKHYDNVDVDIHGGLTFAAACSHGDEATSICHVPAPGTTDDIWWLGFDCAHAFDYSPAYGHHFTRLDDDVYRDVAYVTAEIERLALQLEASRARV